MTMLKKLITLLLAVALLLPGAALADYGENFQSGTHITVGTVSRLTGNFFTEMWGNNTADMDIRELLHGLSTITWDEEQQYGINANVVRQIKCDGLNEDGSKTYTILLYNNMRFSDGELMSAQDFVFSILLQASPVMAELGVDQYDVCFVCMSDDFQSSLEITSLLKEHGAHRVVSKADRDIHAKFLLKVGADYVVTPERDMAQRTAVRFSARNTFDYIELADDYAIFELETPEAWVGRTAIELNIRARYNVNIIGTKYQERMLPYTDASRPFERGAHLILAGSKKDILRLTNARK